MQTGAAFSNVSVSLIIYVQNQWYLTHAVLKAPYSLKLDIFIIKERLNKLTHGSNAIIKCGTCKISVSLSLLK